MPDLMDGLPIVEMFAYRPSWSIFLPEDSDGEGDQPSIEVKAGWLARSLKFWATQVEPLVMAMPDLEAAGHDLPSMVGEDERATILDLLESLLYAADTLLAFKKRDHQIEIPARFLEVAQVIFARAEEQGIQGKDRTLYKIARRVEVARRQVNLGPTPIHVDERGRVFDLSGKRLFEWDPEKMLLGQRQYREGKTHSLDEILAAEARHGQ